MANSWRFPQFLSPSRFFLRLAFGAVLLCSCSVIFLHYVYANKSLPNHSHSTFMDVDPLNGNIEILHSDAQERSLEFQPLTELAAVHALWNVTNSQNSSEIPVLIPFVNAKSNPGLQAKFETCVSSMARLSSAPILMYVVGDKDSHIMAAKMLNRLGNTRLRMVELDIDILGHAMEANVRTMQQHFSYQPGSYYSHTLFFLSTAIHQLAPPTLQRLIMLDADLLFKSDIQILYDLFHEFAPTNMLGIAYDMQPVYRHVLWKYRQEHPHTRLGSPKPDGLPGFNSGVLLMDLDKMRKSALYNRLLDATVMKEMSEKYYFKGHLGDQDFYTLVSFEHEDLFYVFPCTWNRQLCKWWKDKGYEDVFDQYFICDGKVNIYHGNCGTPFPSD